MYNRKQGEKNEQYLELLRMQRTRCLELLWLCKLHPEIKFMRGAEIYQCQNVRFLMQINISFEQKTYVQTTSSENL